MVNKKSELSKYLVAFAFASLFVVLFFIFERVTGLDVPTGVVALFSVASVLIAERYLLVKR